MMMIERKRSPMMVHKVDIGLELDGVTHINVSYLAKTHLGKLLNDSSSLLYEHVDTSFLKAGVKHKFTAYGYLAFLLTGQKDYMLAHMDADEIREHMTNATIKWTRDVTILYREALKARVAFENNPEACMLLRENTLPIVSYTVREGKVVMRKNDRILVNLYDTYKPPLPDELEDVS